MQYREWWQIGTDVPWQAPWESIQIHQNVWDGRAILIWHWTICLLISWSNLPGTRPTSQLTKLFLNQIAPNMATNETPLSPSPKEKKKEKANKYE